MTFEEAELFWHKHTNDISGNVFASKVTANGYVCENHQVSFILIAPVNNWRDVAEQIVKGIDNKKVLEELGFMHDDLEVIVVANYNQFGEMAETLSQNLDSFSIQKG